MIAGLELLKISDVKIDFNKKILMIYHQLKENFYIINYKSNPTKQTKTNI
jgi:hypothetical protein